MTRSMRDAMAGRSAPLVALPLAVNSEATRLADIDARLGQLQLAWDQLIPTLLDSVSIAVHEARGADHVHDRIDGVREDMDRLAGRLDLNLIDLKHRLSQRAPLEPEDATACTVLRVGAVAAAIMDGPQLFFAQHEQPTINAIKVGRYPNVGVDIVAPCGIGLPFGPGSVKSIVVAADFDLGLTLASTEPLLVDWLAMLAPQGSLVIRRIDFDVLLKALDDRSTAGAGAGAGAGEDSQAPGGQSSSFDDESWTAGLIRIGFENVHLNRSQDGARIEIRAARPGDGRAAGG